SFLFTEPRPANEGREDERRYLAPRKDGSLCRAWAVWAKMLSVDSAQKAGVKMRQAEWAVVMLRDVSHSACCVSYRFAVCECNYHAENDVVDCREFRRFGRGACPGTPHI